MNRSLPSQAYTDLSSLTLASILHPRFSSGPGPRLGAPGLLPKLPPLTPTPSGS